jgi:folate-binding protein YgfZ
VYAAFLNAKGHMQADVRILRRANDILLDVPSSALAALLDLFRRTVPPLFARVEDLSATHAMIGIYGARASDTVGTTMHVVAPATPGQWLESDSPFGPAIIIATPAGTLGGFDVIVPRDSAHGVANTIAADGVDVIDSDTFDVMRIENSVPMWGVDMDDTTIPLEAGLLERAISTSKGCYTGQEVIIRVLHRGHVNWHLRGLLLGDAQPPARGASLVRPGDTKAVGRVTSAAHSSNFGQTIALAYVRREVEPAAILTLENGASAEVVALPFNRGQSYE